VLAEGRSAIPVFMRVCAACVRCMSGRIHPEGGAPPRSWDSDFSYAPGDPSVPPYVPPRRYGVRDIVMTWDTRYALPVGHVMTLWDSVTADVTWIVCRS
jgi:hypothetical protein